jgi:hypothetical protein
MLPIAAAILNKYADHTEVINRNKLLPVLRKLILIKNKEENDLKNNKLVG